MHHIGENIHKHQPCRIPDYFINLHVNGNPVYVHAVKIDLGGISCSHYEDVPN